jgi:diguanylate cyclase (GGDEF)-like protein
LPGRGLWHGLHEIIEGAEVPEDLRERLYLDQASDFAKVITGRACVGLCSAGLLGVDFAHAPGAAARNTLFALLYALYALVIAKNLHWLRRSFATGEDARAHIADVRWILIILGILWGFYFNVLEPFGSAGQRALIYGIAVGCLATPVLVSPLTCAFAFWFPVAAGILICLIINHTADPFSVADVSAFIALTGYCIIYLNRRMNERALGAIRLEENNAVIKLLLRDFEESASDWLWETNAALEIQRVSQRLAQVARRPAATITGRFPGALLGEAANAGPGTPVARLNQFIADRAPFRDLIIPVTVEGEERFWSLTAKPIIDKFGHFSGYHGVGSDITGQRRQQEQISFLARHDSLTKLPNRVLFSEVLHQACDLCDTTAFALLCLDLDHFKVINDTLGHATGDGVLVAVGERLRGCIRERDVAARLGGDEFGIIVRSDDRSEIAAIAARVIERISRPYHFDGQMLQIGISIGITLAPLHARTPNALLKNADLALYRAKSEGRAIWRYYDSEMDERLQGRRALQYALRTAIERNELVLFYQPIVNAADRRIVGAEALIRWQHPERGLLGPIEFIPIAEESGLIGAIGEWVLREACRTAATWPADISVAVNLSPLQFRDSNLVESIDRALAYATLPASRLELEITETTMLETSSQTVEALWKLHGRGVRIALDDFGTGYSSLSYLRRFPFDKIKIDRTFIRDLGYEKDDSSIILAIIGLAERMNMAVVAEGVETDEQAALLTSYGCPLAQGYLYARPLPAHQFAMAVMAQEGPSEVAAE